MMYYNQMVYYNLTVEVSQTIIRLNCEKITRVMGKELLLKYFRHRKEKCKEMFKEDEGFRIIWLFYWDKLLPKCAV